MDKRTADALAIVNADLLEIIRKRSKYPKYAKGYDARTDGKSMDENPYNPYHCRHCEYLDWQHGWQDADLALGHLKVY
jgi:hypothetical protein